MTLRHTAILLSLVISGAQSLPSAAQAGGVHVGGFHAGVIFNRSGTVNQPFIRMGGGFGRAVNHLRGPGRPVAVGAAIGFVSAANASDWAGAPPGPGYCWYYTDVTRWYGFWDQCP